MAHCNIFTAMALLVALCHVLPAASRKKSSSYDLLASSIKRKELSNYDIESISSALKSLSSTQAALKKIDGTAHEMYQRTHKSSTSLDENDDEDDNSRIGGLKVKGRMSRNAARVGCVADALFASELCEMVTSSPSDNESEDGTLANWTEREIVYNSTILHHDEETKSDISLSIVIISEPKYTGGAGIEHGGIEDLLSFAEEEAEDNGDAGDSSSSTQSTCRGRFIIILSDRDDLASKNDLPDIISTLDVPPISVRLKNSNKNAILNGPLYQLAGKLIKSIHHIIDLSENGDDADEVKTNDSERHCEKQMKSTILPAIHIVGHSRAGAVGAIASCILDGILPMPDSEVTKRSSGCAHDRVSALCLGCPPCMAGIEIDFITSIINGDDVVCRLSYNALKRLYGRVERSIKGGVLGKGVGWMSDAARLTVTGLTSGNTKKQDDLAVPGRVYLLRPRRIGGGSSSIHEVGGTIAGRENFRAAVLWQLNDVLLSNSLWKHHNPSSYIQSLDRVKLKGFSDQSE